jgi:hypothetical protein
MTNVKDCLADPFIGSSVYRFICAIYGHAHQDEIAGLGCNNNMKGLVISPDNV